MGRLWISSTNALCDTYSSYKCIRTVSRFALYLPLKNLLCTSAALVRQFVDFLAANIPGMCLITRWFFVTRVYNALRSVCLISLQLFLCFPNSVSTIIRFQQRSFWQLDVVESPMNTIFESTRRQAIVNCSAWLSYGCFKSNKSWSKHVVDRLVRRAESFDDRSDVTLQNSSIKMAENHQLVTAAIVLVISIGNIHLAVAQLKGLM